ncbi:MAG: HAMP domain-containing protein [Chloroflexi bacterium]|nr:HAMP domain-containing protein [Chloroflexota bacterium]
MFKALRQRWDNFPLAARLAVMITSLVVVVVISVTLLAIRREQQTFRTELRNQASLILDTLAVSSADDLYLLDGDALSDTVMHLNESPLVIATHFYDDQGRPIGETTAGELAVDPLGQQLLTTSGTWFDWESDSLRAGRAITAERQQLGAVSVVLSTRAHNEKVADTRQEGLIIALGTAALGGLLAIIMSQAITNPLKDLLEATRRLAAPDAVSVGPALSTDGKAIVHAHDEVGQLAQAFNEMADAIQKRERDLRAQAENLHVATLRAQEASRIKGEFLANMSHELRTPLNAIIGFGELLLMGAGGPISEQQEHYLKRLHENGQRLLTLVSDILDLTRIEANRVELAIKPFAPRSTVERLVAQVAPLSKDKNVTFTHTIEASLPQTLAGDEKRVEQVVVNLLSNAFKFTEQGTVTLKVWADPEAKTWMLSVSDTGVGIPPHALDVIFEEFRQVDGSSTRAYAGTGLGLAIARNLVRIMGGQIKVDSQLEKGSTFTVSLPLVLTAEEVAPVVPA